jgi:hypothetical protein
MRTLNLDIGTRQQRQIESLESLIQRSHQFHSQVGFPYRNLQNRLSCTLNSSSNDHPFLPFPTLASLFSSPSPTDQLSSESPLSQLHHHPHQLSSSLFASSEFQLLSDAQTTRPTAHASLIQLSQQFLSYKQTYGSSIEKRFDHNMSSEQFFPFNDFSSLDLSCSILPTEQRNNDFCVSSVCSLTRQSGNEMTSGTRTHSRSTRATREHFVFC